MTDGSNTGVAADHLRQLIERIEPSEVRARYVMDRFEKCAGISTRDTCRAVWLASRVLGTDYIAAFEGIRLAKIGSWQRIIECVAPDVASICGYVYRACSDDLPGRIKIGFSANPEARVRKLSRIYRRPIKLIDYVPGTMLDEHAEHCLLRAVRIEGEWFASEPFAPTPHERAA